MMEGDFLIAHNLNETGINKVTFYPRVEIHYSLYELQQFVGVLESFAFIRMRDLF